MTSSWLTRNHEMKRRSIHYQRKKSEVCDDSWLAFLSFIRPNETWNDVKKGVVMFGKDFIHGQVRRLFFGTYVSIGLFISPNSQMGERCASSLITEEDVVRYKISAKPSVMSYDWSWNGNKNLLKIDGWTTDRRLMFGFWSLLFHIFRSWLFWTRYVRRRSGA